MAKPQHRLAQAIAIASLVCLASGSGISIPGPGGALPLGAVWAQDSDVSAEEIVGYAASVLEMDSSRSEAYGQIQTLLTGTGHDINSIDLSCAGTAGLNQLPRSLRNDVRTVIVDYCNQASTIVQANGLTVRKFNAITAAHPQDPALAEQIRAAMLQQQAQDPNRPANGSP